MKQLFRKYFDDAEDLWITILSGTNMFVLISFIYLGIRAVGFTIVLVITLGLLLGACSVLVLGVLTRMLYDKITNN